jgi:hypothetical protein
MHKKYFYTVYLSNFLIISIVLCLDILHKFHYKNKYFFYFFLLWVLWFYFTVTLNLIYIVYIWKQYIIIILLLNIERHYKHLLKKKQKKDKWCYKSLLSFIYIYNYSKQSLNILSFLIILRNIKKYFK